LRRLLPTLASATDPADRGKQAWVSDGLTFQGLKALGVPQDSLDSFPSAFQQGMAARAERLGEVGENAPERWEPPLGTPDVHLALAALSPDAERLEAVVERARAAYRELSGTEVIWRQDAYALPGERTSFGVKDGISHPAIEGSGILGMNPHEAPLKAGEFILGYPNESGNLPPLPQPEVLDRNGTYVVIRKLHTRVAAYRQ
jgi:deferrochelatase/peroxidase EfeB